LFKELDSLLPTKPLKVGDRVGVGFFKRSCHQCEMCYKGSDNLCPNSVPQFGFSGNNGGFADYIRVDSRWAFPIPSNITSDKAAPLLCAGATVFAPLYEWDIQPNMNVAVIGLGGLGHLFVMYAKKLGCEVTVFSTSEDKLTDTHKFGGKFYNEKETESIKNLEETFDFILNTTYGNLDYALFLSILKPNGVFCQLGFPSKPITIPAFPLIYKQRKFVGSNWASSEVVMKALLFSSKYEILPEIERFSIREVNKVLKNFEKTGFHYRAVLKCEGEFEEPLTTEG